MAIDAETQRLMLNWAAWRSGSKTGIAMTGAYELEARGGYQETAIPIFEPEASEVNDAVNRLELRLKEACEEYWLRSGTVEDKARRCGCAVMSLYRRLERAYDGIKAYRSERRERRTRCLKPAFS